MFGIFNQRVQRRSVAKHRDLDGACSPESIVGRARHRSNSMASSAAAASCSNSLHPLHIWSGSATVRASLFREAHLPKRQRSNTALNDCRLVQPAAVRPRTRHRLFELVVRAAGTNGLTASKTTHISLPESRTTKRRARRRPTSPTASSKGCR